VFEHIRKKEGLNLGDLKDQFEPSTVTTEMLDTDKGKEMLIFSKNRKYCLKSAIYGSRIHFTFFILFF
jgi:hypothetical protein